MNGYWRVSLFAMMLASAGLPIYIHLPRFAAVDLGLNLATVGAIVMGIRVFDFAQDPILGRIIDHWRGPRRRLAAIALGMMAVGFVLLFSVRPVIDARLWLIATLVLVFSGYSFGAILLYGDSAALAGSTNPKDQLRLATYREVGLIAGVIFAAVGPVVLSDGFRLFGWALGALIILSYLATRNLWDRPATPPAPFDIRKLLAAGGGWLLLLAVVNSLPVAITSTLFLFFVEDRLMLPNWSGGLLILFFAASGLAIPIWSRLARHFGVRPILLIAMLMSVAAFIGSALLDAGDAIPFAIICVASGAAVGAELVILPAVFASLLGRAGIATGQSFGLWSFATKLSLPLAALMVLPALDVVGFVPAGDNSDSALDQLTLLYAVLPCALKIVAAVTLLIMPKHVTNPPLD